MNIRTITLGIPFDNRNPAKPVKHAAQFLHTAKKQLAQGNIEVQTIRLSTNIWDYKDITVKQALSIVRELDKATADEGIDFFNLGTASYAGHIQAIPEVLAESPRAFSTATICSENTIDYRALEAAAPIVGKLAEIEHEGFANLRFAVLANLAPGAPFFPGAYHRGKPAFSLGFENSGIVYNVFSQNTDISTAAAELQTEFEQVYKPIETECLRLAKEWDIIYGGLDVSIAPSVAPHESIAYAVEQLGIPEFGLPGTLTAAATITEALRKIAVKTCGYSGLMLPVLEDYGLAERNAAHRFNLQNLLLYSSVCGTGLDTIPLPGDLSEEDIYHIFFDVASLSAKLNKPLSARLMPIPGKRAGDTTNFDFDYFVNSKVMHV